MAPFDRTWVTTMLATNTNLKIGANRATDPACGGKPSNQIACGGVSPTQSQTITFGVDASGSNLAIALHTKKGELTLTFFLS